MLYSPFWTTTRPTSLFCPQLSLGKAYMELGWLPGLSVARPCRQPRWKRRLSGQEECSAVSKAGLRLRSDNWIWGSPSISFRLVTRSSASGGSKQLVYVQRLTRLGVTAQNVLPPVQTWLFEGNWECIQGILRVGSTSRQEKSRRRLMQRCRKQVGMAATTHSGGRSDGVEDEGSVVTSVAQQMGLLLESEPYMAAQAAAGLVTSIDQQGRAALLTALFSSASNEADGQFMQADANADGVLDRMEFASYVEAQSVRYGQSTKPLTPAQLYHLSTRAAIGMIGFGFTDNAIMIIAGDAIQSSIGGTLGLHTLLSAGLGNAVADLVGTAFRGYIERISSKFMPEVHFSSLQMQSKEAWWAETAGASVGVTIGCLLGLVPPAVPAKI